jgi:hypothetical protein
MEWIHAESMGVTLRGLGGVTENLHDNSEVVPCLGVRRVVTDRGPQQKNRFLKTPFFKSDECELVK